MPGSRTEERELVSALIALEDLTKHFGPIRAVDGVSMSVAKGEVLGFLGPNGAGKSTTMKMVAGFLTPTAGRAWVAGIDVVADPVGAKRQLGYLPEGAPSYGDMTARGFLEFIAAVRGFDGSERGHRVDEVVEKVAIADVLHQPIDTLSKGYKRRVGLAQALVHDPEVLIMDEPTDGLDPNQKHQVRTLIQDMAADKAVIISTHILEEVEAVCSRAVVIARGRILADGTPADLLARSRLHNAVRVELEPDAIVAAREALSGIMGVEAVEEMDGVNGARALRVVPKDGRSIAVDVGAMLSTKGIATHDMYTEKGALDEVFRQITTAPVDEVAADA